MKYVLELEDKPFVSESGEELYRAKGFKSLVFDKNGIDKLERLKEPEKPVLVQSINVGDEVKIKGSGVNFVVTKIYKPFTETELYCCGYGKGGGPLYRPVKEVEPTGRHFHAIVESLKEFDDGTDN